MHTAELAEGLIACQVLMLKGVFLQNIWTLSQKISCKVQSVWQMSKAGTLWNIFKSEAALP